MARREHIVVDTLGRHWRVLHEWSCWYWLAPLDGASPWTTLKSEVRELEKA